MSLIDINTAAACIGVSPLEMRIMIQKQLMPENVAVYVKRDGAQQGRYIIWKEAFYKYYGVKEAKDA